MLTSLMKVSLLLLASMVSSACIGVAAIGEHVEDLDAFILNADRGSVSRSFRAVRESKTKDDVLALWGQPSRRSVDGTIETWSYRREMALSGLVFIPLIPIPLVLPVGFRHSDLIFDNGHLVRARVEDGAMVWSAVCFPADDVGYKCALQEL